MTDANRKEFLEADEDLSGITRYLDENNIPRDVFWKNFKQVWKERSDEVPDLAFARRMKRELDER